MRQDCIYNTKVLKLEAIFNFHPQQGYFQRQICLLYNYLFIELRIFRGCFCGQLGQGCLTISTPKPLFSLCDFPKMVPAMGRMLFIPSSVRYGSALILKLTFFEQSPLIKWLQATSLCHPQNSYLLSNRWWKSLNSLRLITILHKNTRWKLQKCHFLFS